MKSKVFNERGIALVVVLLITVVLTLLGLAAVNTSSFDTLISGNYKRSARALAAAEAGVEEVIARMSLRNNGSVPIASNGSQVDPAVNGVTNAYIGDTGSDPNWQTKIFFTSTDPTDSGSTVNTSSLLPSSDWADLNYTETSTANAATALTVKHATESDLGLDLDSDAGTNLPVYFSTATGRNVTGTGSQVELITSIGRSGDARRTIKVELCRFPISVNPQAAVAVGMAPNFSGSGFISGFDHLEDTVDTDDATGTFGAIQTDGIDSYGYNGDQNEGYDGSDDPDVEYAAKLSGNTANYLPGSVSNGFAITPSGSMDIFGGNGSVAWKNESLGSWQTLAQVLGLTIAQVNGILATATVTESNMASGSGILQVAPQGVIFINNNGGQDLKITSSTPSSDDGYGLMYVTGDVDFQNLTFKGLIYIEGDAKVTGNFWILGAFVNRGDTDVFAAGNGTFLFSRAVLDNINQYMNHSILSWKEE
ncbi:MAG: PilX N-terminal domain-containing pilus assembly protein [Thermodesulfobacteriota bacterium]|nr:PilX N-terminal domain-containing pilus assembly protein [Thermodesulfobacteriota bacterium]